MNKTTESQGEISKIRLIAMRFVYLLTFIGLAPETWQEIINPEDLDPLGGVAMSFWAMLATLMLLGVRYPAKMLPLLLLQFFYKLTWLLGYGYPLWSSGQLDGYAAGLFQANAIGVGLDLFIIPWPYVFRH